MKCLKAERISKFEGLNVSSKFAICGMPIRWDSYKTCSFGCEYCFAENRKIMEYEKTLKVANLNSLSKRLNRVFDTKDFDENNLLDKLISNKITWHAGGMSDPFQPIEGKLNITRDMVDISSQYDVSILFSTKSDTYHNCNLDPSLHTFQLSFTNNKDNIMLEPNVAPFEKRVAFYRKLKDEGFKVGLRFQPLIPGITTPDILDSFPDADMVTFEFIKLVPQNEESKRKTLDICNLDSKDFTQKGLLCLKPEIRYEYIKPFIERAKELGIPYSVSDNDLRYLTNNKCCCGDRLVKRSSMIDTTYMIQTFGKEYPLEYVSKRVDEEGLSDCVCNHLFTSNRTNGCKTVKEFYNVRFERKASNWGPQYMYYPEQ